jgi:hypothetical protein
MLLRGTSRRCIGAARAAVNYIARIAGITCIIRIKINVRASDVLPRRTIKGIADERRQLRDVYRDAPRLVPREHLRRRSPAGLILEVDVGGAPARC